MKEEATMRVAQLEPQASILIPEEVKHEVQNPTLASSGCLRRIYTWSEDSTALLPGFVVLVVLVIVFGGILLSDTTSLLWLVLFGLVASLVTFLAPLLRLSKTESTSFFSFLRENNNSVRVFMILEAIADIVLAVYLIIDGTTSSVVFELAIGAVACASTALLVLFRKKVQILLAIVLTDTADVLLIVRVVVTGQVEEKDVLLYLFLVLNVVISELSTLFAIVGEERKQDEVDQHKEFYRRQRVNDMRVAMQGKATVQTVVTGLLIIPIVLTSTLRKELNGAEVTLLVVPPIVTFFWITYIQMSETKVFYFSELCGVQVRESLPRFVLVLLFFVIAFVDEALSLAQNVQAIALGSYAFYLLCPLLFRVYKDYSRTSVLKREVYSLREVDFSGRATDFEMKVILLALGNEKSKVESIDLTDMSIYSYPFEPLFASLRKNRSLKTLKLAINRIDYESVTSLADALKVNTTLMNLDLGRNEIGPEGCQSIAGVLKVNTTTLTSLNLERNKIGHRGCRSIAEALIVNSTLTELNLKANNLGDEGVTSLADALKVNTVINLLNLSYNGIGDEGAISVSETLQGNETLAKLNLESNRIGDEGVKSLADALKVKSCLTDLNLASNKMGNKGAMTLSDSLEVNETLTKLNLFSNKIGNDGARSLAKALKANNTITELNLGFNFDIDEKTRKKLKSYDDRLK